MVGLVTTKNVIKSTKPEVDVPSISNVSITLYLAAKNPYALLEFTVPNTSVGNKMRIPLTKVKLYGKGKL